MVLALPAPGSLPGVARLLRRDLAVHGRLGIVPGRAGAVHVASGGRGGGQALMSFLEFAMNGNLALQVLTVQSLEQLVSWLLAR